MVSIPTAETGSATPAQIAALSVSIFAILVFTGISIYLCGRHKGCKSCKESTQQSIRSVSHLGHHHHHHHHHTHERIPTSNSTTGGQDTNDGRFIKLQDGGQRTSVGRFTKLKEAFGIKAATTTTPVTTDKEASLPITETEAFGQSASTIRATSPLHIGIHPSTSNRTSNRCSGSEEFQAAVHNLLGYQAAGELQEWYSSSESDDDSALQDVQPELREERFSAIGPREGSPPLPAYEEVAEPRRFSWQGHESDYRPEKR